ncbi:MAG: general secretion pathway protein GspB [Hahellaceae bacterium]|nr:general secretion pathway protein GspB [Hahellaceae bacterium]
MSYILDALKKSEQERQQGKLPPFASQHMILTGRKKRPSLILWLLVVILTGNLLLLTYWLLLRDNARETPVLSSPVAEIPMQPAQSAAPLAVATAPVVRSTATVSQPVAVQVNLAPPPVVTLPEVVARVEPAVPAALSEAPVMHHMATPEPASAPEPVNAMPFASPAEKELESSADISRIPTVDQLSSRSQQRIPELIFNSHIYTPQPDARRVMINNIYLREGQPLGNLRIEQITEEGVVLSLEGEAFRLQALRDWRGGR